MNNKYTPLILSHVCIYSLRRNQLNDALNQISRAIQKNIEKNGSEEHHSLIDLYFKKAFVHAKLKQNKEAYEHMEKTSRLRQKIYQIEPEDDRTQLKYETQLLPEIEGYSQMKLFRTINAYIDVVQK